MDDTSLYNREWDYLIIGTGMGGATLGYALARAGKSVMFCERGRALWHDEKAFRGDFAECFFPRPEVPRSKHRDTLLRAGRYCDEVVDVSFARPRRFIPFLGMGMGGSTALYGMALERFFPADFTPKRNYPRATDSTLPDAWPVDYVELRPYYEAAEELYRVRRSIDPCRAEERTASPFELPPFSPSAREFHDFFKDKGLHPYQLPKACEQVANCQTCQGYVCSKDCKNDSVRICLEPALRDYDAHLLDECEVLKLEATRTSVTRAICSHRGQTIALRAGVVVLAAGALESPRLLLNSASPDWPSGLANDSGLVGKNLMRHYVDLYAVSVITDRACAGPQKELALNDFYLTSEDKFGTLQSFGSLPPVPILLAEMEQDVRDGPLRWAAPLFKLAKPALKPLLGWLLGGRILFASIVEDLPYEDNQVMLPDKSGASDGGRLQLRYHVREHDRLRIKVIRQKMGDVFRPYRFMLLKQAENNQRIAHACGTCRFGHDPKISVLDRDNRAHGLTNLFVVDASFFPSSGGTNPGLTIAANALRVADRLLVAGKHAK
jgi:choline dehydrogenase-like flavoprotein